MYIYLTIYVDFMITRSSSLLKFLRAFSQFTLKLCLVIRPCPSEDEGSYRN